MNNNTQLPEATRLRMEKSGYRFVGENLHSAVKPCTWVKKSIRSEGVCYKEKFYHKYHKTESHRCMQMSPSILCCNACVYCWRDVSSCNGTKWQGKVDDPEVILNESITAHISLLAGFKGSATADKKKWKESQDPTQIAISLIGEPTFYPRLSELIELSKNRGMAAYLVSNGQLPENIKNIHEPSQLYLSLDAPTKEIYQKIDVPKFKDFWERINKTIELFPSFSCKKAIRLTIVKGWNDNHVKEYAKLIEKTNADFVEVKSYMWVGYSQYRLGIEAMPNYEEIQEFAKKVNNELGYKYANESEPSRVVLLSKK